MGKKLKITIVGPGRLGATLAIALNEAGYELDELVSRDRTESLRRARGLARKLGAQAIEFGRAAFDAEVVWICVGDGAIKPCAELLASRTGLEWRNKTVFHASGALSSDELDALQRRGARIASVHPMMSFVHASKPSLAGVTFALEGDAGALRVARGIARDLGGEVISLKKSDKVLYHAWGGFASPLIVAELAVAELIAQRIGISGAKARKTIAPMLRQTIENYLAHGPAAAFSGPIVRGDVGTVRGHLKALKQVPLAREVYLKLAGAAVEKLPAGKKDELFKVLRRKL